MRSGNGDVCKLISSKYSCVLRCCERSRHAQPAFARPGTVSEGWEFKDITIFWSVEVRGDFALSVNGIVWQRQLANEGLPHQRLCSPGVSSRLTTNRNSSWCLGFPKQEAAKSSKRAIHFPVIMMLLLYLLGRYRSVFSEGMQRRHFIPIFHQMENQALQELSQEGGVFLCRTG